MIGRLDRVAGRIAPDFVKLGTGDGVVAVLVLFRVGRGQHQRLGVSKPALFYKLSPIVHLDSDFDLVDI